MIFIKNILLGLCAILLLQCSNSELKSNPSKVTTERKSLDSVHVECPDYTVILSLKNLAPRTEAIIVNSSNRDSSYKISLPSQLDYNGFSTNYLRSSLRGFSMSIEYGSRIYFEKIFDFECDHNEMSLVEVTTITFDKHHPADIDTNTVSVSPSVVLSNFDIEDFLGE